MTTNLAATVGQRVVRLPTAARRQVQQKCTRASRAEAARLREEQGRAFPFIYHGIRAAMEDAKRIRECKRTPELALTMAMFQALSDTDRAKAETFLAIMALTSEPAARAAALIKTRTVGEQHDLHVALDRLEADSAA